MRMLIPLAFAALMTLAPAPAQATDQPACPEGQVETPEGCSQQAWVDGCPPDRMCAASDPGAPGECGADVCDTPISFGPDGCIDCMQPPVEQAPQGAGSGKPVQAGFAAAAGWAVLAVAALAGVAAALRRP